MSHDEEVARLVGMLALPSRDGGEPARAVLADWVADHPQLLPLLAEALIRSLPAVLGQMLRDGLEVLAVPVRVTDAGSVAIDVRVLYRGETVYSKRFF